MIGVSHVRARTKFLTYIYFVFSYTLYITYNFIYNSNINSNNNYNYILVDTYTFYKHTNNISIRINKYYNNINYIYNINRLIVVYIRTLYTYFIHK